MHPDEPDRVLTRGWRGSIRGRFSGQMRERLLSWCGRTVLDNRQTANEKTSASHLGLRQILPRQFDFNGAMLLSLVHRERDPAVAEESGLPFEIVELVFDDVVEFRLVYERDVVHPIS